MLKQLCPKIKTKKTCLAPYFSSLQVYKSAFNCKNDVIFIIMLTLYFDLFVEKNK